jgi:rhomboid protease GluP
VATDGDIDFTTYTREQLDSAVSRMDHIRYPINSRNLTDEYQRRRLEESKAAALAKESQTTAVPDPMLTAPKAFEVMFEPQPSFLNWLGPSRNDFHLIGSGTIQVDQALVRVKGRRFSYWMGIPVIDTDHLGRQYIMNVEVQGRAVRFELRVPAEKVRGMTLWLKTAAEAKELSQLLPSECTPECTPQLHQHVAFERSLIAQSPKTPVTYALFGLCVFVYVGTALGTYQWWDLAGPSLVRLGSNFGPYTTGGDWWRLVTSMFLHGGLLHLAFNMWALASFGPVVERLYGSISFALLYLIAGVVGSLASVSWSPAVNSVGASGAIFGLLGALIAAQVRNDGSIPGSIVRPLRNSSLIFTGCALLTGLLNGKVDNADHIGGVAAGFILGLLLSRPVTGLKPERSAFFRRVGVAALASILILGMGVFAAEAASKRLTGEGMFAATVYWFTQREEVALNRWRELGGLAKTNKWDGSTYGDRIESDVVPFWREAQVRLAKVNLPITSSEFESLQFLKAVTEDRVHAYELVVQGLRKDDVKLADEGLAQLGRVDKKIHEHENAD